MPRLSRSAHGGWVRWPQAPAPHDQARHPLGRLEMLMRSLGPCGLLWAFSCAVSAPVYASAARTDDPLVAFALQGDIYVARADDRALRRLTRDGKKSSPHLAPTGHDAYWSILGRMPADRNPGLPRGDQRGAVEGEGDHGGASARRHPDDALSIGCPAVIPR